MVVHASNPRTQESEVGRDLWMLGGPGLHSKFQATGTWNSEILFQKIKESKTMFNGMWLTNLSQA